MSNVDNRGWVGVRALAVIPMACGLVMLSCGSGGAGEDVGMTEEASSGTCPVTITTPYDNEGVGSSIQISVSQSCTSWTKSMIAYIDNVDCSSASYPYPNAGCHTTGGAQDFSTSTWVHVTPGPHKIVVNNWNSTGTVGSSTPNNFSYGVVITSPTNGASVSNPVSLAAAASEDVGINQMQVWDNTTGVKLGAYSNTDTSNTWMSITKSYTLGAGSHQLIVEDLDNSFKVIRQSSTTVTVSSTTLDPVLIGAGDIGMGDSTGAGTHPAATGAEVNTLLKANPGAMVFTLGDNAYGGTSCNNGGTTADFNGYYDPYWGAGTKSYPSFLGITLPTVGNHDYNNCDLSNSVGPCSDTTCGNIGTGTNFVTSGYLAYFNGRAAVSPGTTSPSTSTTSLHYGFDFKTSGGKKWRFISVDSGKCFYTSANCAVGSSEYNWLSNELSTHTKGSFNGGAYTGVIVATHLNRWSSDACGGGTGAVGPMFDLAHSYKVDLFIDGHVHGYERFTTLGNGCRNATVSGCAAQCDSYVDAAGPVLINLGTGGADTFPSTSMSAFPMPGHVVGISDTFAVGRLRLHDASWDFTLYNTSNAVIDGPVTFAVH
ncbi:MAG TPA: Ig-like domain-containing protein [Polyangiaceae bacterium]|jgi:hypothetical protein|nr:Ig-like domain-containing protein [Polyangiaceae bacterium]